MKLHCSLLLSSLIYLAIISKGTSGLKCYACTSDDVACEKGGPVTSLRIRDCPRDSHYCSVQKVHSRASFERPESVSVTRDCASASALDDRLNQGLQLCGHDLCNSGFRHYITSVYLLIPCLMALSYRLFN